MKYGSFTKKMKIKYRRNIGGAWIEKTTIQTGSGGQLSKRAIMPMKADMDIDQSTDTNASSLAFPSQTLNKYNPLTLFTSYFSNR
jgi:hypothetical protein